MVEHLLNEIILLTFQNLLDAEGIQEITEEMKEYIQIQDIHSLNRAIDERQKRIDKASSANAASKQKVEELLNQLSIDSVEDIDKEAYPQVEKILGNKERLRKIYRHIYEVEKTNSENAEGLLKGYKDSIKELHTNKKAMQAYNSNQPVQSIMINRTK